ncbi:hypothetical protein SAMN06295905_3617 [Devosia lucknowensis]|uniref:Uncharacterized protein n=1 Tax=Devosia lucknowensis TaxID=1096929 RepID=A0A1Y6GAB7_9HYPH|nr:hypothetical protein [Devosia lucknowensis]SMQ86313.1 hypothetical protein SAMN06295905_3617 [Devosia lucknowensis]
MDQPESAPKPDAASITLSPDQRPVADEAPASRGVRRQRGNRWPLILAASGLVLGVAAIGAASYVHMEGQREILRLSTELAQLRVSLDLYARTATSADDLTTIDTRLSALEQGALGSGVPMPATAAVAEGVAPPPAPAATASADADADCLPVGMRLLVASGDRYPICEHNAEVAVSVVDNGYITLGDGTSVASGGTSPLPGNPACTIAVTSGGDEGLTGYAEIRVTC